MDITNGEDDDTLVGTEPTAVYTAMVTPAGDSDFVLNIAAGAAMDLASNLSTVAEEVVVVADLTAPTVTGIESTVPDTESVRGPFEVTVAFSEPVNGFTAIDLTVTNGGAEEPIAATNRSSFTVRITPDGGGPVSVQSKGNAVTDDAGNEGPAELAPATPFSRTVMLPEAPGKPTGMSGKGARKAIRLSWTAPADNGGAMVTGYRIEFSATGEDDDWTQLITNTGSSTPSYWHAGLAHGETVHYRVYAINVAGERDASDAANATSLPAPMPEVIDVTEDGRVSADDGIVLCYRLRPPRRPRGPPTEDAKLPRSALGHSSGPWTASQTESSVALHGTVLW